MREQTGFQLSKGITVAIMSGPNDGSAFPLAQEQFVIGNVPEAQIRIEYDPDVPSQGVTVRINGEEVILEDRTTGNRETKNLGELFLLGQTWVAIYRKTGKVEG